MTSIAIGSSWRYSKQTSGLSGEALSWSRIGLVRQRSPVRINTCCRTSRCSRQPTPVVTPRIHNEHDERKPPPVEHNAPLAVGRLGGVCTFRRAPGTVRVNEAWGLAEEFG